MATIQIAIQELLMISLEFGEFERDIDFKRFVDPNKTSTMIRQDQCPTIETDEHDCMIAD